MIIEELPNLAQLRDRGVLTEEEYREPEAKSLSQDSGIGLQVGPTKTFDIHDEAELAFTPLKRGPSSRKTPIRRYGWEW
jgi:hypothetical protein